MPLTSILLVFGFSPSLPVASPPAVSRSVGTRMTPLLSSTLDNYLDSVGGSFDLKVKTTAGHQRIIAIACFPSIGCGLPLPIKLLPLASGPTDIAANIINTDELSTAWMSAVDKFCSVDSIDSAIRAANNNVPPVPASSVLAKHEVSSIGLTPPNNSIMTTCCRCKRTGHVSPIVRVAVFTPPVGNIVNPRV